MPKKENGTLEEYTKQVYNKLAYLQYAPNTIHISKNRSQRVNKLFESINMVAATA